MPFPQRNLTATEVGEVIGGFTRFSIYALMRRDPSFPRPIRPMGPTGVPRWRPADVAAWMEQLAARARVATIAGRGVAAAQVSADSRRLRRAGAVTTEAGEAG
jgi:predicted DNA-binding transcriptional regulator AlpA